MRNEVLATVLCWALAGTGCRQRARVELPSMTIPASCASEITLVGCDARTNPPTCKSARVKYRKGCEEIVVGRKEKRNRKDR